MHQLLLLVFVLTATVVQGQKLTHLKPVAGSAFLREGTSVIYGNFIQRLGFSSGGFPQDVRLYNLDTQEYFAMRVKPTFKSAKENRFCYFIKPGRYAIVDYYWTQSKWYGGKMFTEPIYKNLEASKIEALRREGKITRADMKSYCFEVFPASIHYAGTWHFDKELVSFSNDRVSIDGNFRTKYKKIDFATAKITLPE
jgi:hypothetical protein